tara:strand:+ start:137 stop:493 length:357 start_codon:yes stop_codon:yes gene_type:complete
MSKKFIISEEEKSDIRSKYGLVNEQNESPELKKAIQCFLNKKGYRDNSNQPLKVDGLLAGKTAEALSKYQSKLGVDADGVWGPMTQNRMSDKDVQIFKQCISDEGTLIDKGLHMLGFD